MSFDPSGRARFDVTHDSAPTETLLCGFSEFGLAGLTAADYLVKQLDLTETGHVTTAELPPITPFSGGKPRHHTRLFSRDDLDLTVLVGELFIPLPMATSFADAVLDWAEGAVGEVAVLSGIPVTHGPDEHRTFYIATQDYHERRLEGVDLPPMGGGFLEGVNGALMQRGLDADLRAAVFATPAHAQTPDVTAALRLLDAVERVYGLDVDTGPLESFADEVKHHYAELAARMQSAEEHRQPEDRMYM
ncbi:proteasome assembly chaperone family protein [Halomarina ordinaria]|uniref:Proteasome assembly chaperone family protein n=1 Tax=Halomarina ordinaria TaxID=3033939 RepID=A0ABD5U5K4_9EURY|nr:PAC2 family protein [Halomarina sp. PSRA2]